LIWLASANGSPSAFDRMMPLSASAEHVGYVAEIDGHAWG
jgi:hypothetical protein